MKHGFTLIEILIVIAIIAILSGILVPVLAAARESGRRANCASNLRQIGSACRMFSESNDSFYPRVSDEDNGSQALGLLHPHFVSDINMFKCPSGTDDTPALDSGGLLSGCSYAYAFYDVLSDENNKVIGADEDVLPASSFPKITLNHLGKGANILWNEGKVEWIDSKGDPNQGMTIENPELNTSDRLWEVDAVNFSVSRRNLHDAVLAD
jgi:prepilin-type N-terminal cleavage/methylation domain-containing protein